MDVQGQPSSSPSKWRKLINELRGNKFRYYLFIVLCTAACTAAFITFMCFYKPKPHSYLDIQVNNMSITLLNISSSEINFLSNVQFLIQKPLKSHVFYRQFSSDLSYNSESIARNSSPPFVQPKESEMHVNVTFIVDDLSFSYKRLMDMLLEDMSLGVVRFEIAIYVETDTRDGSVNFVCKDLMVLFSDVDGGVGKLFYAPKQCNVYY